jgi:hypothetical protein
VIVDYYAIDTKVIAEDRPLGSTQMAERTQSIEFTIKKGEELVATFNCVRGSEETIYTVTHWFQQMVDDANKWLRVQQIYDEMDEKLAQRPSQGLRPNPFGPQGRRRGI